MSRSATCPHPSLEYLFAQARDVALHCLDVKSLSLPLSLNLDAKAIRADVSKIELASTNDRAGAFWVTSADKTAHFNQEPASEVLYEVEREPEHIQIAALTLFILHELLHIPQGIGDHADVQSLKGIDRERLARLDLRADLGAALLLARQPERLSRLDGHYQDRLRSVLALALRIGLAAFGVSHPAKAQRFLGLALAHASCARPVIRLQTTGDLFFWPVWKTDDGRMSVSESDDRSVPIVQFGPEKLSRLDRVIQSRDWQAVLRIAVQVTVPAATMIGSRRHAPSSSVRRAGVQASL